MSDKTKAALQSCQCHYEIFKQSQDITLIVAVNYRAKFCAQWVIVILVDNSLFSWQSVKLRFAHNPLNNKQTSNLRFGPNSLIFPFFLTLNTYGITTHVKTTDSWFKKGRNLPFNPNQLILSTPSLWFVDSRCEENRISLLMKFSKALKSASGFSSIALKELRIFFIKNSPDFLNASINIFWSVIAVPRHCGEDNAIDSLIIKKGPNSDSGRIFINKLNNETIKSLAKFCHCTFFLRAGHHCSPSADLVAFLSWRRLISPSKAATTNCPVLSPGSFNCSIAPAISCGTLAAIVCDFRLTALVAMLLHSLKGVLQYVRNKKSVQHLTCSTPLHKLVLNTLCCLNTKIVKPGSARTLTGPLTTNR